MLKFHCHRCDETFRIELQNLYNKLSISCPNCGLPLPEDAVIALRNLSESYMDVIDALYKKAAHRNGWSISVDPNESLLPGPVGEFDFLDKRNEDISSFWEHRRPELKSID